MSAALSAYWAALLWVGRLEKLLGFILLWLMVVTIGVQVFTRYLFGIPLVWVEEAATYAFVWATFLGAAAGLKQRRHVVIETFVGRLPPRLRAAAMLVTCIGFGAVLWTMMSYGLVVMAIESRSSSVALPIDIPRSWFYSTPLFVSAASMMATLVAFAAQELITAVTGRRPELAPA